MKDTYDKKCAYSDDKSGKIHIFNFISYYKYFLIKNIVSICKISNNHRKQHKKNRKKQSHYLKKSSGLENNKIFVVYSLSLFTRQQKH